MRLTTKITLGIVGGLLSLAIAFIIICSFGDRKDYQRFKSQGIPQDDLSEVSIQPFKTVVLAESEPGEHNHRIHLSGNLVIKPLQNDSEREQLFLPTPLLNYISTEISNDTLRISIDSERLYQAYREGKEVFYLNGLRMYLHTKDLDLVNRHQNIHTDIQDLTSSKIKIETLTNLSLKNCIVDVIEPVLMRDGSKFNLKNTQVKQMNIDFDKMNVWLNIEDSQVETWNITGSQNCRTDLQKCKTKTVNWMPRSKEASLSVTLQGDTARIVF